MHEAMVCTIGHSNRSIEDFIGMLWTNEVATVIDVRTIPRSRHNPQFNLDSLPESLATAGIAYQHMPGLGGLRHAHADSLNTGWHNASFRGYADYMQTAAFAENVDQVVEVARTQRCALMCAEAVPWRCHRSMIADALLVRGVRVEDIVGPHGRKLHALTSFAHVDGRHVTYPPPTVSGAIDVSDSGHPAPGPERA
jgi:uncharacterized protein (DUF488 family)